MGAGLSGSAPFLFLRLSWRISRFVEKSQRARQFMAAGQFAEAIPHLPGIGGTIPGNRPPEFWHGQHMAGRDSEAAAHLEQALQLQPDMSRRWR
jgi:hypothetical protein